MIPNPRFSALLFNRTQRQLTAWYTVVMGAMLGLSGWVTYQMVAYSHWQAVEQEVRTVSGILHDSLEAKLTDPGTIPPSVEAALPGLCLGGQRCANLAADSPRHVLGIVQQKSYYLQFLTVSGQVIALLGQPPMVTPIREGWQTVVAEDGSRYRQMSLRLKTVTGTAWGYMQVGRSLREYDDHLHTLRWLFLIGLPVGVVLVGGTGWWLAGLSMNPIYQSYERMQQFTADAAHELRTPVAAIQTTVEAAQGTHPLAAVEIQDTLAVVARQNRRLAQLVEDLLLLARMDQQTYPIKQVPCCLNDLVTDLVEELHTLEIAKTITLTHHLRIGEPLLVMGDEAQLGRLIANLVTNALQYTPPGGAVTVILEREHHQALIHVHDTGIGIPPEEQRRIFQRFYRVHSDRSRHTGGAGLGLAIAKAIAEAHHGTIQLQSEQYQGSTFMIRLPLLGHKF